MSFFRWSSQTFNIKIIGKFYMAWVGYNSFCNYKRPQGSANEQFYIFSMNKQAKISEVTVTMKAYSYHWNSKNSISNLHSFFLCSTQILLIIFFPSGDELSKEYRTYIHKNHQNQNEGCTATSTRLLYFSDQPWSHEVRKWNVIMCLKQSFLFHVGSRRETVSGGFEYCSFYMNKSSLLHSSCSI